MRLKYDIGVSSLRVKNVWGWPEVANLQHSCLFQTEDLWVFKITIFPLNFPELYGLSIKIWCLWKKIQTRRMFSNRLKFVRKQTPSVLEFCQLCRFG